MQTLEIKNFGPIKDVKIEINDIMIFIGPQASGKSTIAKNIFYFNSMKDFVYETVEQILELSNHIESIDPTRIWKIFHGYLRTRFVGFWGTTKHLEDFVLNFSYKEDISLCITLRDGRVQHTFSDTLKKRIDKIFGMTANYISSHRNSKIGKTPLFGDFSLLSELASFKIEIQVVLSDAFNSKRRSFFIPANRSILTTLPEYKINQILSDAEEKPSVGDPLYDPYMIDLPTKQFIRLISFFKYQFTKDLDVMISERENILAEGGYQDRLAPLLELIPKVLKGVYKYEAGVEKLYLPETEKFVKINFASSGQQESLWIVLHLFQLVLNRVSSLVVIEEPETHLYTDAQVDIVNLLAHFHKLDDNQLVITTHSPYVLSAFNNLIFANEVGRKKEEKISSIIHKQYWLDSTKVSAMFVDNGKVENILDPDLNQIAAERIDSASRLINEQYDQMMEHLYGE
ncbi:MAG: hypothetical protein AMXMBFR49_29010 [Chlorobiota bacterium]